jgi:hypothetical protein
MSLSLLINDVDVTEYLAPQGLTRKPRKIVESVTTMDGTEHVALVANKIDWSIQFHQLTTAELRIIENAIGSSAYFTAVVKDPVQGTTYFNLKALDRMTAFLSPVEETDYWMPSKIDCTEL